MGRRRYLIEGTCSTLLPLAIFGALACRGAGATPPPKLDTAQPKPPRAEKIQDAPTPMTTRVAASSPSTEKPAEPTQEPVFRFPGATHIAIVDFNVHGDNAEREDGAIFGDYLNDALNEVVENELPHQGVHVRESELEIRRIRDRKIESYRAARRLGRDIDADVVLWGKSDCQMPKGAEVILRGRGRNTRIVGGKAALRNVDRVDIDVEGGATGTAQDLDVSGSVRRPQYAVCTYAAMVKWHIGGKRDKMTEPRPRDEVANIPFGELALGQPGLVIDLVLGLHFAKRYEPKTARPFLQSAAATVKARPELFELALWIAGRNPRSATKSPREFNTRPFSQHVLLKAILPAKPPPSTTSAACTMSLGDKKKALAFYNQALPLRRDVGDRAGEAATLNNIGGVYDEPRRQKESARVL